MAGCCVICYLPIIILRQFIYGWESIPNSDYIDKDNQQIGHKQTFDYQLYDDLLSKYVTHNGTVKYMELILCKQDLSKYENWINIISNYGPKSTPNLFKTDDDKLKYYINAYNALTIYGVIYCSLNLHTNNNNIQLISSVMNIKYNYNFIKASIFFYVQRFILDNEQINLHKLENKIIRNKYNDCRIHCAINCASISCPQLQSYVINISDLDNLCKEFVNNTMHVLIDDNKKVICLSKIFSWYKTDFRMFYNRKRKQNNNNNVDIDIKGVFLFFVGYYGDNHLSQTVEDMDASVYSIEYLSYDWGLNTIKPVVDTEPFLGDY